MTKNLIILAAFFGFMSVALGAFGAHGLKNWLASLPDGAIRQEWWQKGVNYQIWHTLLLLFIALAAEKFSGPGWGWAAAFNGIGIVLFSGSLFVMTLTGIKALGMVTPFGGLAFLAAWTTIGITGYRLI